jgi:tetratricopeptide (TPR) repeat protein
VAKEKHLPLPISVAFKRMNLKTESDVIEKRLASVNVSSHLIQDYVPLYESLEWELSQLHWEKKGLLPFVENDVPFIVNNSGRLSLQAALLLFDYCERINPTGCIALLEMGAGTGLFASYLLDTFKSLCGQKNCNYHNQVRYYITDYSKTTVEQWCQRDIFSEHADQVIPAICDGLKPGEVTLINGDTESLSELDVVFCNYMLDILPSTVLQKKEETLLELCVRTNLNRNNANFKEYANLSYENIRELAASKDPESRNTLSRIVDALEFQTQYLSIDNRLEIYAPILQRMGYESNKLLLNHGAIQCLERCLELTKNQGWILINDYGPSNQDEMDGFGPAQRFGSTIANGLNFPMLKKHFENGSYDFIVPDGNEKAAVQCRILTSNTSDKLTESFNKYFRSEATDHYDKSLYEARGHQAAGRKSEALDAYHQALLNNWHDWTVAGEISEFLIQQIQDFQAGVEVAQHAIQMNPWYSTWLWNVLGDGLFCMEKFKEAHEAYLQAERIDEKDPRTNLNLAYTYFQKSQFDNALQAVARGLTHDVAAQYRGRLLEKQQQVLTAISGHWLSRQERLINRSERLN